MEKNIYINISTGTFLRLLLISALVVFAYIIRDVLALVLLSVVVASGIEPAASWFQKRKVSRVLAVIFVYLLIFSFLGVLFYLIVPTLFTQLNNMSSSLPRYLNGQIEEQIVDFLPSLPDPVVQILYGLADNAKVYIEKIAGGFLKATTVLFGGAFSFVMVFVLSFYLSVQERGIENFLRTVIPLSYEEYVIDLWLRTRAKLGSWLKGQLLLGLLVGVLVFLSLSVLGVKYALILALLAAVFEIIPIFGPVLSAVAGIMVSLLQGPGVALMVAGMYFIIQQFENHLIYPLVIRRVIGVPPILSILAIIIGGKIGGFIGMILAVPAVTLLVEILGDLEKRKRPVAKE